MQSIHSSHRLAPWIVVLLVLATQARITPAQPASSPVSFDAPGSNDTEAAAISDSCEIVGRYLTSDGVMHAFQLNGSHFTNIDFPGSTTSTANWITPGGVIGGSYNDATGRLHGFVLENGRYTTVDYPGAVNTAVYGISSNGTLIGVWNAPNEQGGYIASDGEFTLFHFPGATGSEPTMGAEGILVGGYFVGPAVHGFLLADRLYITLDCPNAAGTFWSSIDARRRIAGGMVFADGSYHGAIYQNGQCNRVDYPGSVSTYANGSNAEGDLVGRYVDTAGNTHGFLMRHFLSPSAH